jgi:hypothetical protein
VLVVRVDTISPTRSTVLDNCSSGPTAALLALIRLGCWATKGRRNRPGRNGFPVDSVVEYHFPFRNVDRSDVNEVLMTNSKGTCWVQGNP